MADPSTEKRRGARLGLAPSHPSSHGSLGLALETDGDVIVSAEPEIGFLHRGAEKLFEVRDYRQLLALANRHDWLAAFGNEVGAALTIEAMLGIAPPPRATWIRTLMAEISRMISHLAFAVTLGGDLVRPAPAALRVRQELQTLMEQATGGRVHFMLNKVGGIREDLPDGWTAQCRGILTSVADQMPEVLSESLGDELRTRGRGVGVLSADTARAMGVSGPAARAGGLDLDLRRDSPYLAYDDLASTLTVPVRDEGDALARFEVLLAEITVSIDLSGACLDRLEAEGPGPIDVRLPKVLKLPEGATYSWSEAPSGITGYYLISTGDKVPWRFKVRAPSFNNVATLSRVLPGTRTSDLGLVLASLFYVVGDIDR